MRAEDTFRIPEPGTSLDSHLWVVIADPTIDPQRVLIVNFTTRHNDSDNACILQGGEHSLVNHETCVNYASAKVVSDAAVHTRGLSVIDAGPTRRACPVNLPTRIMSWPPRLF
jgi:hypothetical protein